MSNDGTGQGSDQQVAARPGPRPFWLGLGVVAIGLVWLWGASGLPQGARYAAVGPGLFVTLAGIGLVVLGLLLTWQIWRGERFEPQDAEDAAANAPMDKVAFATAVLAVTLPIVMMKPVGMPVTALVAFVLVARAFGSRRLLLDVGVGAVLVTAVYFLFTRLGLQLGGFFPPFGF